MNKFANGKIYIITCRTSNKCYIGSTTSSLGMRLENHEEDYQRYLFGSSNYVTAYEVLEGNNYFIELLQNYDCNSRYELNDREGMYIKAFRCVNKYIPNVGIKKGYFADYVDRVPQRQFNCCCGSTFTLHHKLRHFNSKKHQKYANEE